VSNFDWTPYVSLIGAIIGGLFVVLAYNSRDIYRSLMRRHIGRMVNWASKHNDDSKAERYFIAALRKNDLADRFDRRKAAQFLGEKADKEAVDALIRALAYDDRDIQKAAATALGKRKKLDTSTKAEVEAVLIDALMLEDASVRGAAAEALGELRSFEAVDYLSRRLKDTGWYVRRNAAGALGKIGGRRAPQYLIPSLNDDDSDVRLAAARALGEIAKMDRSGSLARVLERAVEPLGRLLQDYDFRVREESAISLGNIGNAKATNDLIGASKDEEPTVRAEVAVSLGKTKGGGALEALIHTLKKDDDGAVRWRAAEALGDFGPWQPITPLCDALRDLDLAVQMAAAEALGKMKDPAAIPYLMEALSSPAKYTRHKAAKALGEIGEPAEEPLNRLLTTEKDPEVRKLIEDEALSRIAAKKYYSQQSAESMSFCRNCGNKLHKNAHFCSACGIQRR